MERFQFSLKLAQQFGGSDWTPMVTRFGAFMVDCASEESHLDLRQLTEIDVLTSARNANHPRRVRSHVLDRFVVRGVDVGTYRFFAYAATTSKQTVEWV